MDRTKKLALFALVAAGIAAPAVRSIGADEKATPAWRKLRPDAPEEPKAELYKCEHPKLPDGWTPPSREDLEKEPWTEGRVADGIEIGKERSKKIKPLVTVEEALKLKNDGPENNEKIVSALCQPPSSDDEVDYDATINRYSAAPNTLNALLSSSQYETWMNTLHMPGAFTFDHEMKPYADAASVKRWRKTPMIDMVELRDDVVWDDGTPVTAFDIEFSYHVIMDPNVPVPAQRSGVEDLKWVKAYDAHTIVYFHKEALVTNIWNVNFNVIPKHIYERSLTEDPTIKASQWHAYWNRNPLAGGPYRLKEWLTGQHVVFERRDNYFEGGGKRVRHKPYFKNVRFRIIEDLNAQFLALKKGEIDEMKLAARQWVNQTNDDDFYNVATKVRGSEWGYQQIVWNMRPVPDKPFFKDKKVRLAMALALDHDEVLKKVYFNLYQPATGPFHPDSPWAATDLKPIKQDLDRAEKILDEAGWVLKEGVREKDGVKFEFSMLVPQGGTGDKVAEIYKQNLKDIGITMHIKMLEWATYSDLTHEHKFEAGIAGWGTGTDPDTQKNVWKTDEYLKGRNFGGYSNPKVDELFEKGQREFDLEKRRKIYQEIHRILYDDQPYLFLFYSATFWAFSKELRGYNFSPRGVFSYDPGFFSLWKPKKKAS